MIQEAPVREPIQPMPPAWAMWFQNLVRAFRVTTVASLPIPSIGDRAFVSDATATTFASIVVGGGSNAVPVYSDGINWRIG